MQVHGELESEYSQHPRPLKEVVEEQSHNHRLAHNVYDSLAGSEDE